MPKVATTRDPQQQRLFRQRGWRIPDIKERYVTPAGKKKQRQVLCPKCHEWQPVSVVPHVKRTHPELWAQWVQWFRELHAEGYSAKQIMFEFGRVFNWGVIARELVDHEGRLVARRPETIAIEPPAPFKLETGSLWSFQQRGTWATHDGRYRGNWAPAVPRNLIERFSKPGEVVLDPFVGGGTSVLEAIGTGRRAIGVDVSPRAIKIATHKTKLFAKALELHRKGVPEWHIKLGDARRLAMPDASVDLICAHPPYLDIIAYTKDDPSDLSRYRDPSRFIVEFRKVVDEMYRVLKVGGVCAVLIGDVRRVGKYIPVGFLAMRALVSAFNLREIIIKEQPTSAMKEYWGQKKRARFFYQMEHEYLFILEKPPGDAPEPSFIHAL